MSAVTTPVRQEADAPEAEPPAEGHPYAAEQEIRLATVMYGGVSLAIYINGAAQELLHLVRATAPLTAVPNRCLPAERLSGTERVYRLLGHLLPVDGAEPLTLQRVLAAERAPGPVRSRIVVDIVSGTSAGGINGICLAAALANGHTNLDLVRDLWLQEGDIGALVNDQRAYDESIRGVAWRTPPTSLLASRRMAEKLRQAMGTLLTRQSDEVAYVDRLDLHVTSTDLMGLEVPLQMADGPIPERRYRNVATFRYRRADGTNDFDGRRTGYFVTFAARATSSFPFAFEPIRLLDVDEMPPAREASEQRAMNPELARFYPDYPSPVTRPDFWARSFADGGILDNKPITHATANLKLRRADLPTRRLLLYVEPDPPAQGTGEPDGLPARPSAFQTAIAAKLRLPGEETIREDVQDVLSRNRLIERVREVIREAEPDPAQAADGAPDPFTHTVHAMLRERAVVDFVAESLVRMIPGPDTESDHVLAMHYLVRAWKDAWLRTDGHSQADFLERFDPLWHQRRLRFLLRKIGELIEARPASRAPLTATMAAVAERLEDVDEVLRSLPATEGAVKALRVGADHLLKVLAAPSDDAMQAAATDLYRQASDAFDTLATGFAADVERIRTLAAAAEDVGRIEDPELRARLTAYDTRFGRYDLALVLLETGTTIGETAPVEMTRMSHQDVGRLRARFPSLHPRNDRLAGASVHHFGAFFEREWRQHDIAWGRLDAAERIISTLLPNNHPEGDPARGEHAAAVDYLVDAAHDVIIRELYEEMADGQARAADGADRTAAALDWFEAWAPRLDPSPPETFDALKRAGTVLGEIVRQSVMRIGDGATTSGPPDGAGWGGVVTRLDPVIRSALPGGSELTRMEAYRAIKAAMPGGFFKRQAAGIAGAFAVSKLDAVRTFLEGRIVTAIFPSRQPYLVGPDDTLTRIAQYFDADPLELRVIVAGEGRDVLRQDLAHDDPIAAIAREVAVRRELLGALTDGRWRPIPAGSTVDGVAREVGTASDGFEVALRGAGGGIRPEGRPLDAVARDVLVAGGLVQVERSGETRP